MPPYFSGTGPPSRPSGAIFLSTSFGKISPRSRSRAPGAISLSAKSFASFRIDCCSEVRSKSKPRVYGVPMFDDRRRALHDDELARIARAIPRRRPRKTRRVRPQSVIEALAAIRPANCHPPRRLGKPHEAALPVQAVRIARRQEYVPQTLQFGGGHDRVHRPLSRSSSPVRPEDEDVAD